ncbi:MAG: hypothetical protein MJ146_01280 [Clostridia bacterium]|nr:hypothetical protein [Clostridia bacterium]
MKSKFKRSIAIILAIVMTLTMSTASVFAANYRDKDEETVQYFQFIDALLGGFDFDGYTEVLYPYVDDLNKYITDKDEVTVIAEKLIDDYIKDTTLNDKDVLDFYEKIKSSIVAIAADPNVNKYGTKLVMQTKDFVDNLAGAEDQVVQDRVKAIAVTIDKALDAARPYLTDRSIKRFDNLQAKVNNASDAIKEGNVAKSATAVIAVVTDAGFVQIASNVVRTAINVVVDYIENIF